MRLKEDWVSIDRAQLAGIRSRSAVTREQLLIEEERFDSDPLDKKRAT